MRVSVSASVYLPSESLLVLGLSSGALVLMSALHALADTLFPAQSPTSAFASAASHPPPSPLTAAARDGDGDGDGDRERLLQCEFGARALAGDKLRRSASAAVFLVDRLDSGGDGPHAPTNAAPSHVVTLEGHRGPITALCYPFLHNSRYDQSHLLSGILLLRVFFALLLLRTWLKCNTFLFFLFEFLIIVINIKRTNEQLCIFECTLNAFCL